MELAQAAEAETVCGLAPDYPIYTMSTNVAATTLPPPLALASHG